MDLVAILRSKIEALPEGDYSAGLRAVLLHIETSIGHLSRGQEQEEETAFTDVIYRTNQAFEGSIKEAYRVLAGQDPANKRPYDIENYLNENNVFRRRVLSQFTNYRTDWRNESTHDYKLDFDECEALLAIISVSAFACVLIDQISEKVAFLNATKQTEQNKQELQKSIETDEVHLIELTSEIFKEFVKQHGPIPPDQSEVELLGSLMGFFSTLVPSVQLNPRYRPSPEEKQEVDLLVSSDSEKVIVELKLWRSPRRIYESIMQLQYYMSLSGIKEAILFVYPPSGGEVISEEHQVRGTDGRLVVIKEAGSAA